MILIYDIVTFKVVKPKLSSEAHEFLFQLMDKNGDGLLDIIDWLDVGQVLKAHVKEVRDVSSSIPTGSWRAQIK